MQARNLYKLANICPSECENTWRQTSFIAKMTETCTKIRNLFYTIVRSIAILRWLFVKSNPLMFPKNLNLLILIHSLIFLFQFIYFKTSTYYKDQHLFILKFESRFRPLPVVFCLMGHPNIGPSQVRNLNICIKLNFRWNTHT